MYMYDLSTCTPHKHTFAPNRLQCGLIKNGLTLTIADDYKSKRSSPQRAGGGAGQRVGNTMYKAGPWASTNRSITQNHTDMIDEVGDVR